MLAVSSGCFSGMMLDCYCSAVVMLNERTYSEGRADAHREVDNGL